MKKLLLTVLFVGLAVGTAQGVTSNPETFETYALTTDFEETSIGDGAEWYTGWFKFEVAGGTGVWEIIDDGGSQVYKHSNTTGWDSKSRWWGKLPDDYQVLKYDVKLATEPSVYNRSMVAQGNWPNTWEYTGMAMLKKTSSATEAILYAGGLGNNAVMPGQAGLAKNVWYTVEMHTDKIANKVKARFGPTGGAMNDWTAWIEYDPVAENYHSHGFATTGEVRYDNISIDVPEPATMMLLGAGSLLLIRRKKR